MEMSVQRQVYLPLLSSPWKRASHMHHQHTDPKQPGGGQQNDLSLSLKNKGTGIPHGPVSPQQPQSPAPLAPPQQGQGWGSHPQKPNNVWKQPRARPSSVFAKIKPSFNAASKWFLAGFSNPQDNIWQAQLCCPAVARCGCWDTGTGGTG